MHLYHVGGRLSELRTPSHLVPLIEKTPYGRKELQYKPHPLVINPSSTPSCMVHTTTPWTDSRGAPEQYPDQSRERTFGQFAKRGSRKKSSTNNTGELTYPSRKEPSLFSKMMSGIFLAVVSPLFPDPQSSGTRSIRHSDGHSAPQAGLATNFLVASDAPPSFAIHSSHHIR